MTTNRFQAQIVKPLQPSSNRLLQDDSVESRLHRFCQAFVDTQINPHSDTPYDVADLNIIMSDPLADYQERHIDFEDYSNPQLKKFPNFSVMLPYEERASACIWDESHHLVDAAHQVHSKLVPPSLAFSEVASILKDQGKQHLMEGIAMKEVFFGTNQMLLFLDNTMHSGAANHMNKKVYRLHFYVVRRNSIAPSLYTFFPSEVVWDLTRQGSKTPKLFLSELKKNKKIAPLVSDLQELSESSDDDEEPPVHKKNTAPKAKPKAAPKPAGRASPAPKKAVPVPKPTGRASPVGDRASSRKRGRPRKYDQQ
jgi:hypothetical protein